MYPSHHYSDIHETLAGVKQEVSSGKEGQKTQEIVDASNRYVEETVLKDDAFKSVRKECKNRHPQCAYWAAIGECEVNPRYMTLQCAPSCQTCDKIDFEARCPWEKNTPSVLEKKGDLDKLFERLTTDPIYQKYEPTVQSSPPDGPWVVTLEKFLTDEECDRLIDLGAQQGYELSRDVGAKKFDGTYDGVTSSGRTSTNAWCTEKCYNDTLTKSILLKIENITGVPETNSEYLQLLRYDVSQFYHVSTVCSDCVCLIWSAVLLGMKGLAVCVCCVGQSSFLRCALTLRVLTPCLMTLSHHTTDPQ